jgi:hypothetical protein
MMLSFTADVAELRKKVAFVKQALGSAKTDLQAQLIRCELVGQQLSLFVANKEMWCRCLTWVDRGDGGESGGSFSVYGDKFIALLATTEAERISFEVDQENLKASTGLLTVNLTLYDGASNHQIERGFLSFIQMEGIPLPTEALEEALICSKSCTSSTSIRPDVNHIELRGGKLFSSDGRKIMLYKSGALDSAINLKVPSISLQSYISAVKQITPELCSMRESTAYYILTANLGEYALGIRKTERVFPDVEGMMARALGAEDEVSVDKHALSGALSGVALGLESDEVKVTVDVTGTSSEGMLEISALNSLGRRSFECVPSGRKSTGHISFPVSYKHLLDTLSVFKGDGTVDMGINTALSFLTVLDKNALREVLTLIPFRTEAAVSAEKQEVAKALQEKKVIKAVVDDVAEGVLDSVVEENPDLT